MSIPRGFDRDGLAVLRPGKSPIPSSDLDGLGRRGQRPPHPHMVTVREHSLGRPCSCDQSCDAVASVAITTPGLSVLLCERCADSLWASLTFRRHERRDAIRPSEEAP